MEFIYRYHQPHNSIKICPLKYFQKDLYQSSSSSLPFCIALCLALNASAKPPAKLGVGVFRPLSVPLPEPPFKLIPESLGARAGPGFLPPAVGRLAGGAGGVGFARTVEPLTAVDFTAAGGGGGGVGRITGAGTGA